MTTSDLPKSHVLWGSICNAFSEAGWVYGDWFYSHVKWLRVLGSTFSLWGKQPFKTIIRFHVVFFLQFVATYSEGQVCEYGRYVDEYSEMHNEWRRCTISYLSYNKKVVFFIFGCYFLLSCIEKWINDSICIYYNLILILILVVRCLKSVPFLLYLLQHRMQHLWSAQEYLTSVVSRWQGLDYIFWQQQYLVGSGLGFLASFLSVSFSGGNLATGIKTNFVAVVDFWPGKSLILLETCTILWCWKEVWCLSS